MTGRRRRIRITKVTRRSVRFVQSGKRDLRQPSQRPPAANRAHCPRCGREVTWLTRERAVQLLGGDRDLLDGLIERGRVHARGSEAGEERVCRRSLAGAAHSRSGLPDSSA